ncbi:MAG: M12 family metallo-peptidase [Phaeodactylibacter sp.]|uniref:reprolysin-like metallopeptidase n=1 Tax=Phaeodactylibacter sp. TaxID=1940289 RepID=UPI0032ED7614
MRFTLTYLLLLSVLFPAIGQQNFWTALESRSALQQPLQERLYQVDNYEAFELNLQGIRTALRAAPAEFTDESPLELLMPMPDGTLKAFNVVETPVMAPGLAQRYPAIKTFRGWNPENPHESIRLGFGPNKGFYATIFSDNGRVYIDQAGPAYITYATRENPNTELYQGFTCEVEDHTADADPSYDDQVSERGLLMQATLRTYRFAVAATGEYTQYHGGTVEDGLEAIVLKVNRLNQVLERDASIRLELIENNDLIIFTDPATDNLSNGNTSELLSQVGIAINSNIGLPNYDIGHVLNVHNDFVGNGVASLSSACNTNKSNGVSGITLPEGDPFVIDIIAHEVGHQFSATHTMNSCQNVTAATAFEPGSGSTIMAYAGICAQDDNITDMTDDHYHTASLQQIFNYTREGNGDNCPTKTPTTNAEPTVEIPLEDGFWIPLSTPFELTAEGSDPDGDAITYCWEQYNLGPNDVGLGNPQGDSPLFRSFSPVESPTRVFPRLNKIISNNFDNTEILPDYGRNLTFRCTVRDNNPQGGNAVWDAVAFKSDETSGPFRVQIPNSDTVVWTVGDYQEVRWDVANTDNNRVRCYHVDIKLSVDGGQTYPFTLLAGTPNDGSAFVTVPDAVSDDARIRVQAADNIFFDISNADFEIVPATEPGFAMTLNPESLTPICLPGVTNIDISTSAILGFEQPVTLSVVGDLPASATVSFGENPVAPGASTTLSIDWGTFVEDTFALEIIGVTDSLPPAVRFLNLSTISNDFSELELLSPASGTADIVLSTPFSWSAVPDADRYDFEIATSPAFGDAVIYSEMDILEPTDFVPDDIIFENNDFFYWRIRPVSEECGPSEWLDPFVFRTASISCEDYAASDLPINISSNANVKISRLDIIENGTISDINLSDVEISYQPVNNLKVSLISPESTEVLLFDQNCLSTGLIRLGFDDEAPFGINCPPLTGQIAQPEGSLSDFDGQGTAGEWQLKVEAVGSGGGGAIESWSIEFCATTEPAKPSLLTNEPLNVPPGGGNTVTTEQLSATDGSYGPAQLKYRIITLPAHGQLFRGGVELAINDHFTQETIESLNLVYVHDGSDTPADAFLFTLENPDGGFIGAETFNIIVDEDAVVNTQNEGIGNNLSLFPNPTRDEVTLQLDRPVEQQAEVMLFNLQGQLLQQVRFPSGARQMRLETADLPGGIYAVSLRTANGQLTKKLIIRR